MEQNFVEVTARFNLDCIKSLLSHFDVKVGNQSTQPAETQQSASVQATEASGDNASTRTRTRWTEEMERYVYDNRALDGEIAQALNERYGTQLTAAAVNNRRRQIMLGQTRIVWDGHIKCYYPQQHPINAE